MVVLVAIFSMLVTVVVILLMIPPAVSMRMAVPVAITNLRVINAMDVSIQVTRTNAHANINARTISA